MRSACLLLGASLLTPTACDRPAPIEPTPQPVAPVMRRLTAEQYANTVRDLFGDDVVVPARLEPDLAIDGLRAIGASLGTVSARGTELYEDAAYSLAEQALTPERRQRIVPCTPADTVDASCAEQALAALGRRAWRRPLEAEELAPLVEVSAVAAQTLGDFHEGLAFGVAGLLQSPSFLFRVEVGESGLYTGWEMASRLSFTLWNRGPDDVLLDAAQAGALDTADGISEQADRLLADPRARDGVRALFVDLFELYLLDALSKDTTLFEHMSPSLGPAAREETLRLVEALVFDEDSDFRDLLTSQRTYVDRELAALYAVPAPALDGFDEVWLPDDGPRRGLLGHASILALQAHPVSSSATLRGKFIRETLLCQDIPPPPAGVDTSIPEASGNALTLRDRVAEHLLDPTCRSCHLLTDPPGLALENFDGIGRYRLRDHDVVIDASGDLDGSAFADAWELAEVVADHPELPRCVAEKAWSYAQGRTERGPDRDTLDWLAEAFGDDGFRYRSMLRALVTSEAFRTVGSVEEGT